MDKLERKIAFDDCIVGVLYGTRESLSACYKTINKEYPVYIGQEFWYRLTGDESFYHDLISTFAKVAETIDASKTVNKIIQNIAEELDNK